MLNIDEKYESEYYEFLKSFILQNTPEKLGPFNRKNSSTNIAKVMLFTSFIKIGGDPNPYLPHPPFFFYFFTSYSLYWANWDKKCPIQALFILILSPLTFIVSILSKCSFKNFRISFIVYVGSIFNSPSV